MAEQQHQTFRRVLVTPAMAAAMLKKNVHNRRLNASHVGRLARAMQRGEWRCTMADPIVIDRLDRLQDGQHRLQACVLAGVPFETWIATGADPDDFDVIGQGRTRSVQDVLGLHGVTNAVNVSATASVALAYETRPDVVWSGVVVDRAQVQAEALANAAEYQEAVATAGVLRHQLPQATQSNFGAFLVLVGRYGSESVLDDFMDGFGNGLGLREGDPRHTLRAWFIRGNGKQHGGWGRQLRLSVTLRAWSAWVHGEQLKMLKFTTSNLPMPKVA